MITKGRTYIGTSGVRVKALETIESGLGRSAFKGEVLESTSLYIKGEIESFYIGFFQEFEKYKEPFKIPSLFQIVTEYQNRGFNIDFDKGRMNENICYIGKSGNARPLLKINYGDNVTEIKLVIMILEQLCKFSSDTAKETLNKIREVI